jgi:hypothetical protein
MPTYNITTNFTTKDNLTENNPLRVIKGSEFGVEFTNIKATTDGLDSARIALNSVVTSNTTSITTLDSNKAPTISPTLTGTTTVDKISFTTNNTIAGLDTFNATTTGSYNTAYGTEILKNNASGVYNVGVGVFSLRDNNTGTRNTAVGSSTLRKNTTADYNTATGNYALFNTTTGGYNTATGADALYNNSTGARNTAIGYYALRQNSSGSYNTGIGFNSNSSSTTATGQVTLGDSNVTSLRCNDTSISSLSDVRDKTDIIDSPYGLDFINTIQPKQYKWQTREGNVKDGSTRIGFIAQELLEACQGENDKLELVMEDNPDRLEAKYGNLLPIMVQAIKDLTARIEELEA